MCITYRSMRKLYYCLLFVCFIAYFIVHTLTRQQLRIHILCVLASLSAFDHSGKFPLKPELFISTVASLYVQYLNACCSCLVYFFAFCVRCIRCLQYVFRVLFLGQSARFRHLSFGYNVVDGLMEYIVY